MRYRIDEIVWDKARYIDLLMEADEREDMVLRYLEPGRLFVLRDPDVKCAAVVMRRGREEVELMNLATRPGERRKGYGRAMVAYLLDRFLGEYSAMLVGTGEVPRILRFYEACGFRLSHRREGFFTDNYDEPIIEDGIVLRDMVYLRAECGRARRCWGAQAQAGRIG